MSAGLNDLLERMREHPAFAELLATVEPPGVAAYSPSKATAETQQAEWIFRSGRQLQDKLWRNVLTAHIPPQGDK